MRALFFLLLCRSAFSSEVVHTGVTLRHLLVSPDTDLPYQLQEYLCVVQNHLEIACGFVKTVTEKGVLVDLEFRSEDVLVGSKVQRANTRRPCDPKFVFQSRAQDPRIEQPLVDPYSRQCTIVEEETARNFRVLGRSYFSFGISTGSARIAGETTLGKAFTLGLSLNLQSFFTALPSFHSSASGTAYGGWGYVTYYPYSMFEKLFVQLGFGLFTGRLSLREDLNSWSGTGLGARIGYRFLNWQGFGVGLSLSADHYSFKNSEAPSRTEFLSPGFWLDFGGVL